jgi:hypothetical protein
MESGYLFRPRTRPPGAVGLGPALETEKASHTGLLDVCNATRSNEMQKRGSH